MKTLEDIQFIYGVGNRGTVAKSGYIPMRDFNEREAEFRIIMRKEELRAIYRGPRVSNNCSGIPSMTRRCDATHVVLYLELRTLT